MAKFIFSKKINKYECYTGFSVVGACGRKSGLCTLLYNNNNNKPTLRKELKNLHAKSQHSSLYSFRDLSVNTDRQTWLDRLG